MRTMIFQLSAVIWQSWFRDKETKLPLSSVSRIELLQDKTDIAFTIPDRLKNNKNAEIYLERCR